MKTKKSTITIVLVSLMAIALFAGCTSAESLPEEAKSRGNQDFTADNEKGSGNGNLAVSMPASNQSESRQGGNGNSGRDALSIAAERLGISEEALAAALGDDRINNQTDFAAAAKVLGISEEELHAALFNNSLHENDEQGGEGKSGNEGGRGNGQNADNSGNQYDRQGGPSEERQGTQQGFQDIDFVSAALALGVTEEELRDAVDDNLGYGPPNWTAVAEELGISEDALMVAIGHDEEHE